VLSAGPGSIPVSVVSSIRSIIGGGANDGKAGATLKVGPTFRGAILFAVAGFGAVLRLGAEVFVFGFATAFTVRSGAAFRPARGEDLFTGLATDLTVRLAAAFFALHRVEEDHLWRRVEHFVDVLDGVLVAADTVIAG